MNAIASDWKTEPLPEKRRWVELSRVFDQNEMQQIRNGLVPEAMEDKWFIYFEGSTLYMHRSWTGFCVYEVHFLDVGNGITSMTDALVNCDPEQYQASDPDNEPRRIGDLIDRLLLRKPVRLRTGETAQPQAAIVAWAEIGRASIGIHPSRRARDE